MRTGLSATFTLTSAMRKYPGFPLADGLVEHASRYERAAGDERLSVNFNGLIEGSRETRLPIARSRWRAFGATW